MEKAILVLLLAAGATLAKPSLGSSAVTLPLINVPNVAGRVVRPGPAVLSGMPAATAIIEWLKGEAGDGVSIQFPDGALNLGSDALPTHITCQTPLVTNLSCHVCNLDCVYVHNTYGGTCAHDTRNPERGLVCVCQDERNSNETLSTAVEVCGGFLGPALDPIFDSALVDFLYVRETGALCTPLGGGTDSNADCYSDCRNNHQYQSGMCKNATTIPMTAAETIGTQTGDYCICDY